jgi:hypothetical protein
MPVTCAPRRRAPVPTVAALVLKACKAVNAAVAQGELSDGPQRRQGPNSSASFANEEPGRAEGVSGHAPDPGV